MNQNLSSLFAIGQVIGAVAGFMTVAKSAEAIVLKKYSRLLWLLPPAVVLWFFCVGTEVRYLVLLFLLIITGGISGVVQWRKRHQASVLTARAQNLP